MKQSGIYQIQSKVKPERIYIGSAISIHSRWKQHLCRLKRHIHHSQKLQRHYDKYEETDLMFTIIEPCLPMGLLAREQEYLDKLKPYFNNCKIAGSTLGRKAPIEERMYISKRLMGNKYTLGFKHTEETKAKMRNRISSKETKIKLSKALKGNKRREGIPHDIETKKKIGESSRRAWAERKLKGGKLGHDPWTKGTHLSPEVKKNISEGIKKAFKERGYISWNKGIPHSPETRRRISENKKQQFLLRKQKLVS